MKKLTKLFVSSLCVVTALSFSACDLLELSVDSNSNGTSVEISVEGMGVEIFEGNYKKVTPEDVSSALSKIVVDNPKTEVDSNADLMAYGYEKMAQYTARYGGMYSMAKGTNTESLNGILKNTYTNSEEGKIVQKEKGGKTYYQIYGEYKDEGESLRRGDEEPIDFGRMIYNDGTYTYRYENHSGEKYKTEERLETFMQVGKCMDDFSDSLASVPLELLVGDIANIFWQVDYLFASTEFEGTVQWEMDKSSSQYIKVKLTAKGTYTRDGFDWEDEDRIEEVEQVDMQVVSVYDKNLNIVANYISNAGDNESYTTSEGKITGKGKVEMYMLPCNEITPPKDLDDYVVVDAKDLDDYETQPEKVESSVSEE